MIRELINALPLHGSAKIPLRLIRFDILDLVQETRD